MYDLLRERDGADAGHAGQWSLASAAGIDESGTVRLEITRKADLAVRALVALGATDQRMKAPALAEELGTTAGFVPQVVGPLVRAGWVRSDPGPTGGYTVAVTLDEVSVLQVVEAIEGATAHGRCVVADRACDGDAPCALHVAWAKARYELTGVLGRTSLAEVAAGLTP